MAEMSTLDITQASLVITINPSITKQLHITNNMVMVMNNIANPSNNPIPIGIKTNYEEANMKDKKDLMNTD